MLFHTVSKPSPNTLTEIVATQFTIKQATEIKYLGLVLDEKLNYNKHMQSISKSLMKYLGVFNHMK